MKITDFYDYKKPGRKISMITVYDYSMARLVENSNIDCLLVGDSAAMTMHGFDSTIHATEEMMLFHVAAVKRAVKTKVIIADMPFLSFRKSPEAAVETAGNLARAGADAIKLENVDGHEEAVKKIIESGIPVMGHLGLTPQYIKALGGYKIQGKDEKTAEKIIKDAKILEKLGCFSIVLECIPGALAQKITDAVNIATIGIGAGSHTDGQVLVLQDALGLYENPPSFAKKYIEGGELIKKAFNDFDTEVKEGLFPENKNDNNKKSQKMAVCSKK